MQPPADFAERSGRFAGLYRYTSSHTTTPEKVARLFGEFTLEISDPGDGTLLLSMGGLRFVEVEPLHFRQVDGPFALVFRQDDRGRVTYLFTDLMPQYAAVKLDWYETPGFNIALALGCVLVFLSMIPVAVIRFIRNRRLVGDRRPASRGARVARWIIIGISMPNLLFLAGIALWFRPMRPSELHGISLSVEIVMGLGVLSALLTIPALVYMVLAWKNSYWGMDSRVYYTLVTFAAVAFVWLLNYWNWLGWRY